jgi:hypothetical protein
LYTYLKHKKLSTVSYLTKQLLIGIQGSLIHQENVELYNKVSLIHQENIELQKKVHASVNILPNKDAVQYKSSFIFHFTSPVYVN